ncbi:MAG: T9SS type A sorting domain-containing protein, partial [Winogradskyella sp.]
LNIKMNSNLKRATIYSVLGAKVLETTSKTITTSNLKNGMYLIKIETENGSISTKRFIKQ